MEIYVTMTHNGDKVLEREKNSTEHTDNKKHEITKSENTKTERISFDNRPLPKKG